MEKIKSKIAKITITAISAVMAVFVVAISAGAPVAEAQFSNNAKNLAGLIAVNNSIGNGGGSLTSGTNNLADLIVLGGLFPTSRNANQNAQDLVGLIAVSNITGGGSGGAFTSGTNDLADLIILNNLFLDP